MPRFFLISFLLNYYDQVFCMVIMHYEGCFPLVNVQVLPIVHVLLVYLVLIEICKRRSSTCTVLVTSVGCLVEFWAATETIEVVYSDELAMLILLYEYSWEDESCLCL
uniref:Uncharacterized protein n=1 Tax=Opuntia streptacantha TaxID=393608 RepID=A0A7C9A405_OPUST